LLATAVDHWDDHWEIERIGCTGGGSLHLLASIDIFFEQLNLAKQPRPTGVSIILGDTKTERLAVVIDVSVVAP